jgi:hypothetical protein
MPDPVAVERAERLTPSDAAFAVRFAELSGDGAKTEAALERAASVNPADASIWIRLGARAERRGQFPEAERCLLRAARCSVLYEPRWRLVNFYFRRNDTENFWRWARAALEMAYQDPGPIFELCWRVDPDPVYILGRAVPDRPEILAGYLRFLTARKYYDAGVHVLGRLLATGSESALDPALFYLNRAIEDGGDSAALEAWNLLPATGRLPYPVLSPLHGISLTNGDFRAKPVPGGFDWRVWAPEVSVRWTPRDHSVSVSFPPRHPESCETLVQYLPLVPSRRYRVRFEYETSGIAAGTGLAWKLIGPAETEWGGSAQLSSDDWKAETFQFDTPPGGRLARLALAYRRSPGMTLIEGAIRLRAMRLELEP